MILFASLLTTAAACGGFFCSRAQPVVQAGENILFSMEGLDITATIQVRCQWGKTLRFLFFAVLIFKLLSAVSPRRPLSYIFNIHRSNTLAMRQSFPGCCRCRATRRRLACRAIACSARCTNSRRRASRLRSRTPQIAARGARGRRPLAHQVLGRENPLSCS